MTRSVERTEEPAYTEGYDAFERGEKANANPYDEADAQWVAWDQGYTDAYYDE